MAGYLVPRRGRHDLAAVVRPGPVPAGPAPRRRTRRLVCRVSMGRRVPGACRI